MSNCWTEKENDQKWSKNSSTEQELRDKLSKFPELVASLLWQHLLDTLLSLLNKKKLLLKKNTHRKKYNSVIGARLFLIVNFDFLKFDYKIGEQA